MKGYSTYELDDDFDFTPKDCEETPEFKERLSIALRAGVTFQKFKEDIVRHFKKNYSFSEHYLQSYYRNFILSLSHKDSSVPNHVTWFLEYEG